MIVTDAHHLFVGKAYHLSRFVPWLYFFLIAVLYAYLFVSVIDSGSFVDEHEQPVAGWFISEGMVPYRDFFSHHAPLPLLVSSLAFLLRPAGDNIILLRVGMLIFHLCSFAVLWKLLLPSYRHVAALLIIFAGLSLPLFNLQMMLANGFVTIPLLAFGLLLLQYVDEDAPTFPTMIFLWGVMAWWVCWSTIAAVIPVGMMLSTVLVVGWRRKSLSLTKEWKMFLPPVLLHALIPVYLLSHRAMNDFIWQAFTFNTQYYFPLRLAANDAERSGGVLYRLVMGFAQTVIDQSTQFFAALVLLLQSVIGSRLLLLQGKVEEIPAYYSLIWSVFVSSITSVHSVIVIGMWSVVVMLMLHHKWAQALLFILFTLTFFFRDNEIFHLSPALLWIVVGCGYSMVIGRYRSRQFAIVLGTLTLLLISIPLTKGYQDFRERVAPVVPVYQQQRVDLLLDHVDDTASFMVLDGQILDYLLARRLPATRQYFYHPWFHAVDTIAVTQMRSIEELQPAVIVISDELVTYAPQMLDQIKKLYDPHPSDQTLWLRRGDLPRW